MGERTEDLREEMGMSSWTDNDLVTSLAKRYTEQSVVMQLDTVSAEVGTAFGIELLLLSDVQEGRPEGYERDVVLDAMITEARDRIASRIEPGVPTNG
jgi:hypothetical protein